MSKKIIGLTVIDGKVYSILSDEGKPITVEESEVKIGDI